MLLFVLNGSLRCIEVRQDDGGVVTRLEHADT
jgi:hypothetical protein